MSRGPEADADEPEQTDASAALDDGAVADEPFDYEFTPASIKSMHRYFSFSAFGAHTVFRAMGKVESLGTENLKPDGPLIVAPLHMSLADPVLVGISLFDQGRMPHFLAKSSLFKGPLGVLLKGMGQIPVLRNSAGAGDSLVYAKKALDADQTVVIYPRGTLTADPDGWPDPSRTGAARLSVETGVPIVPAAHWGLQESLTKHSKKIVPHPRRHLRVLYGQRIDPAEYAGSSSGIVALTHRLTRVTAELLAELKDEPLPERFKDL